MSQNRKPERPDENRFGPTKIIKDETSALLVAENVARHLRAGAASRDYAGEVPWVELDYIAATGLGGILVPRRLGGAGISTRVYVEVLRRLAQADGSLAQLVFVDTLKGPWIGELPDPLARRFAKQALLGERWGNASAERSNGSGPVYHTTLSRDGDGYVLNGEKYFSTGALTSHQIMVVAVLEDATVVEILVPNQGQAGLQFEYDWDVVGQRTTFSVTTRFKQLPVSTSWIRTGVNGSPDRNAALFAQVQLAHAALQLGIGDGALAEARRLARARMRPDGEQRRLEALLEDWEADSAATRAIVDHTAAAIDHALSCEDLGAREVILAVVGTDEAKSLAYAYGPSSGARLSQFLGAEEIDGQLGYDRYWRDARTHSLHDPIRWRQTFVGRYWLNGTLPPDLERRWG